MITVTTRGESAVPGWSTLGCGFDFSDERIAPISTSVIAITKKPITTYNGARDMGRRSGGDPLPELLCSTSKDDRRASTSAKSARVRPTTGEIRTSLTAGTRKPHSRRPGAAWERSWVD